MDSDIKLHHIISANVEYYTNLWSTILFWGSLLICGFSEVTGKGMMLAALALLAVRLVNNKLSMGNWLGYV